MASGFDYTTVSRYVISAWNLLDPRVNPLTGIAGSAVLQAGAYINSVTATAVSVGSPLARGAWYTLPGPVGSAAAPLALQAAPGPSSFSTVVEFTTPGSNAWTAPSGVTKVDKAEVWGGGGGGGGSNGTNSGGGGGGGGEYARELNVPVNALGSYPATVGAAGTGGAVANPGTAGGYSFWSGQSGATVSGRGGRPGWGSNTWGGGKGGSGSVNALHYDGGNGRQANVNGTDNGRGGGGGGSGGTSGGGNDCTGRPGAAAVTGGGPGGDGGNVFVTPHTGSVPSTVPGGGGGGGAFNGGNNAGAAGKVGKVRLSYGAAGLLPLASLLVHTPGPDDPDLLNPYIPVGNGADTPNGATEYLVPAIGALRALYDGTYTMYLVAGTWNTPGSSRNLTVQVRQYPYSGGTAFTQNVVRSSVTPNTDVVNGFVDMGAITLPLNWLPPGNSDGYFALTVTSSNTADRFLDVLLLSTTGNTLLVNIPIASIYNNMWIDEPDHNRALGAVLGSDADRDRSFSLAQYIERLSGGPLSIDPQTLNRLLVYSAQGCPAITATYLPRWMMDRVT
jgi:hypothetical protein